VGDWVKCPVSGVDLQIMEASTRVEFEGRSYVVCCPGCAEAFNENPRKFLEPVCRGASG
jgi:YHS domain-containing protein